MTPDIHQDASPPTSQEEVKSLSHWIWMIAGAMIVFAVIIYPYLPDTIPTHWNINNEIDAWSPKFPGALFIPALGIVMAILFPLLERIDPKRMNYADFRKTWAIMRIALMAFIAFMEVVTFTVAIKPEWNHLVGPSIIGGIGALFIVMGNYMGKLRQNWFIGLRTPWTLDDPEVWKKSQRMTGRLFVISGIAMLAMAIYGKIVPVIFFSIIVLVAFVPMVYSYILYTRKRKQ